MRRVNTVLCLQIILLVCLFAVSLIIFQESKLLKREKQIQQKRNETNKTDTKLLSDNVSPPTSQANSSSSKDAKVKVTPHEVKVKPPRDKEGRITAVVIFTTMRSGSSFTGELFNQHTQVFYAFEPLHAFWNQGQETNRMRALEDVVTCNFSHLAEMYKHALETKEINNDKSARCASDNFCFRGKSKFLRRDTDLCTKEGQKCAVPFNPERLSEICKRSLFPVAKIIAEPSLQKLHHIMENDNLDVRVIHLVRDPRAVLTSRRKVFARYDTSEGFEISGQSEYLCSQMESNLNFTDCFEKEEGDKKCGKNTRKWKNKYMRLRFEDVSLNPQESAKKIYDFVGLNFDSSIKGWINDNTKAGNSSDITSLFTTKRNSLEAVGHWRKILTFDEVKQAQLKCRNVLKRLNYKTVLDADHYNNATADLWW